MSPANSTDDKLEAIRADVALIKTLLTGNGTPERGLVVRMDRLEQSESRRGRFVWAAVTASFAAVAATAARLFA